MLHVLTLAHLRGLDSAAVDHGSQALATLGWRVLEHDWTQPGLVCDLHAEPASPPQSADPTSQLTAADLRPTLDPRLDPLQVDWAWQPAEGRKKRLLVADMESTVIRNEMLDELADWVGLRDEVAGITAQAMRGELDFHQALRRRVALLEGLAESVLDEAGERIEIDLGAPRLVATLRRHGVRTVLCSGGFTVYTRRIARQLGFDADHANQLVVRDGHLTGEVVEPILDRGAKVAALERHCAELGIAPTEALAVGDGANDLPLLQAVGLGVAFHAKPAVNAAAGFRVRHGDLSTLLAFLGYRDDEIADPDGIEPEGVDPGGGDR